MLSKTKVMLLSLASLLLVEPSFAARSGGSGTSSASRSSIANAGRSYSYKPSSSSSYKPHSRTVGSRAGSTARAAASNKQIDLAGASPQLAQRIQSSTGLSGTTWLGLGLLTYLLSQHDLSSKDRSWIEGQIASAKLQKGEVAALLDPVFSPVIFSFDGLKPAYKISEKVSISVIAKTIEHKVVDVRCVLPGANISHTAGVAAIDQESTAVSASILQCTANGVTEKRMVRVLG
jgi:hypothetical protein